MAVTLSDLLQRGYSLTFAVTVEGIPYIFTEAPDLWTVSTSAEPALPTGYSRTIACLAITEGQSVSVTADRVSGIAAGNALDVTLAWAELEDEDLLATLFGEAQARTIITADVDAGDATFTVGDTTGFTGGFFVGRERVTFSGSTGTSFTGCTRGVAGLAYDYESSSPTYRWVTDRPLYWRGRFVTLHAHVVTAEGRLLDSTWLAGSTHLEVWKGFVDEAPLPAEVGMVLRCLPLVRLAGMELGYAAKAQVLLPPVPATTTMGDAFNVEADLPIRVSPTSYLSFKVTSDNGGGAADTEWIAGQETAASVTTLGGWMATIAADCDTALTGEAWYGGDTYVASATKGGQHLIVVMFTLASGYYLDLLSVNPGAGAYWMHEGTWSSDPLDSTPWGATTTASAMLMMSNLFGPGWYLPVKVTEGEGWADVTLPSASLGLLEQGNDQEIVRWDDTDTSALPTALLRIVERGVNGTGKISLMPGKEATLATVTGHVGEVGEVVRVLLESSGTGLRGADDTLALGQGWGVPAAWIDTDTTDHALLNLHNVAAVSDGRASMAQLVGGWLAVLGRCLVQRTDSTGALVLSVRETFPVSAPQASTLSQDQVLVSGVSSVAQAQSPNEVIIDGGTLGGSSTRHIIRDVPRIQAEGPRSQSYSAPSMDTFTAVDLGASLIQFGTGVQAVTVPAAPWATGYQVGDAVICTLAHPLVFDYATGSRAPASIPARVVGWHLDLFTGARRLTLLLAGNAGSVQYLCPTATIDTKNSTTDFDLGSGEGQWFTAGDSITFYEKGKADSREQVRVIDTITDDNITLTVAASSWVVAGIKVTYPDEASATATQDDYAYFHASTLWGP